MSQLINNIPFEVAERVLIKFVETRCYADAMNMLRRRPELATSTFSSFRYADFDELIQDQYKDPLVDIENKDLFNLLLYPYDVCQTNSPLETSRQIKAVGIMAYLCMLNKRSNLLNRYIAQISTPTPPFSELARRLKVIVI